MADRATVADLDQVVDFRAAADAGLADAGAVDAGIGLDLDVVFDGNVAGLDDFVPAAGVVVIVVVMLGEAETVAAYDYAVLEQNVVS